VQVRAEALGVPQQLAQPRTGVALAALRRVGPQERREGGDLDGQVRAGDRARFVVLEDRPFGQRPRRG
jgi:hypothetical protein